MNFNEYSLLEAPREKSECKKSVGVKEKKEKLSGISAAYLCIRSLSKGKLTYIAALVQTSKLRGKEKLSEGVVHCRNQSE